jgi:signal peptidase II
MAKFQLYNRRRSISPVLALVLSLTVFALDRWTKHLVETSLGFTETKHVIPHFFDIVRSQNPGIAFGLFAQSASHFRTAILIGFSVLAILILAVLLTRIRRWDRPTGLGVALVFGGALGNVYDRLHSGTGTVTDFLDFYFGAYHWYTFNLADTAICVGAGLLILSMLRAPHVT